MKCSVEGCEDLKRANGMCAVHNSRFKRTGTTDLKIKIEVQCKGINCIKMVTGPSGLCVRCYKQKWYLNDKGRDSLLPPRTSKERWIHSRNGYVMVKQNNVLTYEHIVLAEKALGKPLPLGAIVHHTGARDDNHGYFKLVICPDQTYHLLIHKRMKELGYENNQA